MKADIDIDFEDVEDESILDELDDFDSEDFWRPSRRASADYLDDMWGRWMPGERTTRAKREDDIIIAHGMVTSFVNSFSRDGRRYQIIFDPNMTTAGTDMETDRVLVTTGPLLDENLTAQQAGRILTGLAVHEISHPRYGRGTHDAVKRAFPRSRSAARISNLLDDVRIEQRFMDDYPGYAGVFEPTLEYVSKGLVARNGGKPFQPRMTDQLNIMSAAIRYESSTDWSDPDCATERDWWKDWAKRWGKEDAPRRHVEAVREALRHIATIKVKLELENEAKANGDSQESDAAGDSGTKGEDSGGEDDDTTDEAGDSGGDEKIDADGLDGSGGSSQEGPSDSDVEQGVSELSDDALGDAADEGENTPMSQQMPTCGGRQSVEQAAKQQGVDAFDITQAQKKAQEAVEEAEFYEDDGMGGKIDVARSMKQLIHGATYARFSRNFSKSDVASRYIRDALIASRTGHENTAHYQKRGRLDHRALHRVTMNDFRLFDRKSAESPGRYLVWMLMDRSGSMDGWDSVYQAQVVTAIADAAKHVPTIRAAAWAWSDAFRKKNGYSYRAGTALVWQSGQPTSEIMKSIDLPSGGTPDSQIMSWAWRAIKREARPSETPVILMCSDGWGASNLGQVIEEARQHGVLVYSVAFGRLDVKSQTERFGRNGFVPWQGSIIATARPLAKLIARIVGRDRRS